MNIIFIVAFKVIIIIIIIITFNSIIYYYYYILMCDITTGKESLVGSL